MVSKEENDSKWLFDVLEIIGVNDEFRKTCQRKCIAQEIIATFFNPTSVYLFGSTCEGSITPGQDQDADYIECNEKFSVIEDIAKASSPYKAYLLVITEEDTPAGYVKLQRVIDGTRQTVKHWPLLHLEVTKDIYKLDKYGRILLFDLPTKHRVGIFSRRENKPALTIETGEVDVVGSYRCTTWPTVATEWLTRRRFNGWPAEDTIKEMESYGFFVIKKGHPFSPEKDFEWRISFSLQERKLMFSLTDVQHKCYILLKMLNREIIKVNEFTSYHWKTCLFYAIEKNNITVWEKNHLFYCVKLCVKQMLEWIKCSFCPNYFIPGDNLFDGKLNTNGRSEVENKLVEILKIGFKCFLQVKSNDICNYMESRESPERFKRLQSDSKDKYNYSLKLMSISSLTCLLNTFYYDILDQYYIQPNRYKGSFIKFLWDTIDHIKQVSRVTDNTNKETRSVLSELLPHIFTCLASNISAIAIQHPNQQVRDFLLLGSFTCLKEAGLKGCLKFLSMLYALQLHGDCEWFLDQLDEEYIKNIPSVCTCTSMTSISKYVLNSSGLNVITCICFLPSELDILPHAMKYEMFRYFGIKLTENEKANMFNRWHYRTVCDCNTFFVFLKYLIKMKLGKVTEADIALNDLTSLVTNEKNVHHIDTGFNLIASIYDDPPIMLRSLAYSWIATTRSWELLNSKLTFRIGLGELKRTQYQFNAAKLHALVLLYNTWFARKPPKIEFCFNCFLLIREKLRTCNRCQISTYCSAKCQSDNLKIHENVCKIVRSYH